MVPFTVPMLPAISVVCEIVWLYVLLVSFVLYVSVTAPQTHDICVVYFYYTVYSCIHCCYHVQYSANHWLICLSSRYIALEDFLTVYFCIRQSYSHPWYGSLLPIQRKSRFFELVKIADCRISGNSSDHCHISVLKRMINATCPPIQVSISKS